MRSSPTPSRELVYVVDDDAGVRDSLERLLRSVGMEVVTFAAVAGFARAPRPDVCSCLLLDVRLQGASGLDLQDQLNLDGVPLPVVFMTGFGDIPMTVRAMKGGAVDFLAKPFREQDLLDAVHQALVDDDPDVRTGLSGLLRAFGYRVSPFAGGQALLTHGVAGIDCIVSDVQMPGMDGFALLDRVRATPSAPPVILMTAFADDPVRLRALRGGAACFLAKPVDAEQLAECGRLACAGAG
jgi:FixJ family two-component response regulator